jgi:phage shock protein A
MGLLSKLFTAIRGGATEAGEAIVDTQALRILDQEIRDAQNSLDRAKSDLTKVMAQRKLTADKRDAKQAKLTEYEGYATQALAKGDEALAVEIATKIAELEADLTTENKIVSEFDASIDMLKKTIQQTEAAIVRMKQQVDTVKATESVQKAQAALSSRHSGTNAALGNAVESLERIKAKQAERAARMDAARELAAEEAGSSLEAKLKQAGITPGGASAQSVLERLKAKQG